MLYRLVVLLLVFGLVVSCATDNADEGTNDDQVSMEDDGLPDNDSSNNDDSDDDDSDDGSSDGDSSNNDDGGSDDDNSTDDSNADDDSDNDTSGGADAIDLIGLWVLSEIRLDDGIDDLSLELLDVVIDNLVEEECYLITFDFKEDGTVDVDSRIGDFEVTGLTVSCPEEVESITSEWSLDGDQLLIDDGVEDPEPITIVVEDKNTLLIEGEDGIAEEFVGSQAVFIRSQG